MKKCIFVLLSACCFLGCSSSEDDPVSTGESPVGEDMAAQPAAPPPGGLPVTQAIESVQADLQAKKYEDVTMKMVTLKQLPKTKEEQIRYNQMVYEVQDVLQAQAATDPQAQAAYYNFGRMMTGR